MENNTFSFNIIGEIGSPWDLEASAAYINGMLDLCEQEAGVEHLLVTINSFGGDLQLALQVYDRLRSISEHGITVHTHMCGLCASAATIIAMAGDHRTLSPYGLMLIHRAGTVSVGNANDHREAAADLALIDERITALYADRTGQPTDTIALLMDIRNGNGSWLTPDEALSYGFTNTELQSAESIAPQHDGPTDCNRYAVYADIYNDVSQCLRQHHDTLTLNANLQAELTSLNDRLDQANDTLSQLTAERDSLQAESLRQQAQLQELADQCARYSAEADEAKRRLETVADLRPLSVTVPPQADTPDPDNFDTRWQQSDRYRQAKKLLGN